MDIKSGNKYPAGALSNFAPHGFTMYGVEAAGLGVDPKSNLTHSIGRTKANEIVLTKREFCSRLMRIRDKLQLSKFVEIR